MPGAGASARKRRGGAPWLLLWSCWAHVSHSTLVARYSFDDGTAAEDGGDRDLDGTISGATATTGFDGSGALAFDGFDDAVTFPAAVTADIQGSSARTLCVWAKIDDFYTNGALFSYGSLTDGADFTLRCADDGRVVGARRRRGRGAGRGLRDLPRPRPHGAPGQAPRRRRRVPPPRGRQGRPPRRHGARPLRRVATQPPPLGPTTPFSRPADPPVARVGASPPPPSLFCMPNPLFSYDRSIHGAATRLRMRLDPEHCRLRPHFSMRLRVVPDGRLESEPARGLLPIARP